MSWSTWRSHKDRVGVFFAHSSKVTEVTVVVLGVMTAANVGEVTGGQDMNCWLWARCAWVSWSILHDLNSFCILFILCTSVLLLIDEVWGDSARYWAQERSKGPAKVLVALVLGGVSNIAREDSIFNGRMCRRGHVLSRGRGIAIFDHWGFSYMYF